MQTRVVCGGPTRKTGPSSVFRWCLSAAGATEVALADGTLIRLLAFVCKSIAMPKSGRMIPGFEHIIGVFFNTRVHGLYFF